MFSLSLSLSLIHLKLETSEERGGCREGGGVGGEVAGLCSTHLVELFNPSNQVRIAGGVLKIDVICRRGWGRTGKIRGVDGRAEHQGGRSESRPE